MWIQVSPAEQVKSKDTCPAWGILISGSFLHFFLHFGLQRQWPQEDNFILVFKFAYMNIFLTPALPCEWAPQSLHWKVFLQWKECLYEGMKEYSIDSRMKIEHHNDQFKWFKFLFNVDNFKPKLDIKPDLQVCKHSQSSWGGKHITQILSVEHRHCGHGLTKKSVAAFWISTMFVAAIPSEKPCCSVGAWLPLEEPWWKSQNH